VLQLSTVAVCVKTMLTTGWVMGVEGGFESGNCISTVGVFGGGFEQSSSRFRGDLGEASDRRVCAPIQLGKSKRTSLKQTTATLGSRFKDTTQS
jgi:hypothetical protein